MQQWRCTNDDHTASPPSPLRAPYLHSVHQQVDVVLCCTLADRGLLLHRAAGVHPRRQPPHRLLQRGQLLLQRGARSSALQIAALCQPCPAQHV